jgi:hypothetical protein
MRALLALIVALALAAPAWAYRVPSSRTQLVNTAAPSRGVDLTVPYTTNGFSTLGVWQGVSPRIISDPLLSPPSNPQIKPVFNLQFYGSRLGPSDGMIGAQPVRPNTLRPRR